MDNQTFNNYTKAGKIAAKVLNTSKKLIKPGLSVLDLAEKTEQAIKDAGAELACPTTVSINDISAHSTPLVTDTSKIAENDIVKLDIGVMIDGSIADTATTICLNPDYKDMNDAAKSALEKALKMATPGTNLGDIGEAISSEITSRGYRPIVNLSGHVLGSYELHSGFNIPNIKTDTKDVLEEDMAVAIEPFATDGNGSVKETNKVQIFRYIENRPVRLNAARQIMVLARTKFHSMPFTPRWIHGISPLIVDAALRQLSDMNALYIYPVLKESGNGMVAQAEHTVIVRDTPVVTTKL